MAVRSGHGWSSQCRCFVTEKCAPGIQLMRNSEHCFAGAVCRDGPSPFDGYTLHSKTRNMTLVIEAIISDRK